jgi:molybdate transport system ATP-binding protein
MSLVVDVRRQQGAFGLDVSFEASGRLTALFGPSGSGKTSLIDIIAGLVRPDHGRIAVEDHVLVDTDKGIFVPSNRRRIGMVFQDARLFPHMNVSSNLRYGRWFTPAAERYVEADAVIDLLGIGHLLNRRTGGLSGGEKQRVAIGRALLASPKLLLMDEPLAALDDARKAEIMPYIERLRDEMKIPIAYVSHSLAEVARLATDVVMLADGKVVASGPTADVLQKLDLLPEGERSEGGSVLEARVASHDTELGTTVLASKAGEIRIPHVSVPVGATVRLRIRARDVIVATERPKGLSALNVLAGQIRSLDQRDRAVDVRIDCSGVAVMARITEQSRQALKLEPGLDVFAVVKTISFDPSNVGVGPRGEMDI